jgi:hypothetical protein
MEGRLLEFGDIGLQRSIDIEMVNDISSTDISSAIVLSAVRGVKLNHF